MATPNKIKIGGVGDKTKQLDDRAILVVGLDPADQARPYPLPVGPNGVKVDAVINSSPAGEQLPQYDALTVDYYGSTNNIFHVYYRTGGLSGTIVATRTINYAGGGVADNDRFVSFSLS
jgi:hypothetical protein